MAHLRQSVCPPPFPKVLPSLSHSLICCQLPPPPLQCSLPLLSTVDRPQQLHNKTQCLLSWRHLTQSWKAMPMRIMPSLYPGKLQPQCWFLPTSFGHHSTMVATRRTVAKAKAVRPKRTPGKSRKERDAAEVNEFIASSVKRQVAPRKRAAVVIKKGAAKPCKLASKRKPPAASSVQEGDKEVSGIEALGHKPTPESKQVKEEEASTVLQSPTMTTTQQSTKKSDQQPQQAPTASPRKTDTPNTA